jgi:hypothetical protein
MLHLSLAIFFFILAAVLVVVMGLLLGNGQTRHRAAEATAACIRALFSPVSDLVR